MDCLRFLVVKPMYGINPLHLVTDRLERGRNKISNKSLCGRRVDRQHHLIVSIIETTKEFERE
jgi:hypothetical protein